MELKPLGDRIVVAPIEQQEISAGGIFLPDTAKERPQEGSVLSIGEPVKAVSVGDRVLFSKFAGSEIKLEGTDFLILSERDVLAIVTV